MVLSHLFHIELHCDNFTHSSLLWCPHQISEPMSDFIHSPEAAIVPFQHPLWVSLFSVTRSLMMWGSLTPTQVQSVNRQEWTPLWMTLIQWELGTNGQSTPDSCPSEASCTFLWDHEELKPPIRLLMLS